jgi:citrate lyase subunit gamma (acyl carrier protein)
MVTLEPGDAGIEIALESIVEKQFGREIRRAITETLESLQIRSAKVKAVDKGALDCTIRARVKTAAARSNEKIVFDWKVQEKER